MLYIGTAFTHCRAESSINFSVLERAYLSLFYDMSTCINI